MGVGGGAYPTKMSPTYIDKSDSTLKAPPYLLIPTSAATPSPTNRLSAGPPYAAATCKHFRAKPIGRMSNDKQRGEKCVTALAS